MESRRIGEHDRMESVKSGRHEVRFEEPDIVHIRIVGELLVSDLEVLYPALQRYGEGLNRQLWLMDMAEAGTMSPESRRRSAEWVPRIRIGAAAMVHAGFEQRIITKMLTHVYRLLGVMNHPTRFFDDEASARAWLASQRR